MNKALLYIHGMGGNSKEIEQFKNFCPAYDCHGIDFHDFTPWGTKEEILTAFNTLNSKYANVSVLANSIGAYFSMLALQNCHVEKAFFISPILDMEALILGMMLASGITEHELHERGEIVSSSGEILSWKYLCYVRDNPIKWNIRTAILYGENDNLTSSETVDAFIRGHDAKLTVMKNGEHWFHTPEQMKFLCEWLQKESA